MKQTILALAAAGMMLVPTAASAVPTAPQPAPAASLVEQVRGTHHGCARHYVPRWGRVARHRHVGPRAMPRACGKRWRGRGNPRNWRSRGCFKAGPIWYCP